MASQRINETCACRLIGITIETRPDQIWSKELIRLRYACSCVVRDVVVIDVCMTSLLDRRFGVTRVQLGVQHTDDAILARINRGCVTADAINAFRLLRECCFKVCTVCACTRLDFTYAQIDMHLMPDLPGASPEIDTAMFNYIIDSEDLQVWGMLLLCACVTIDVVG
jgi:histone acetyltransferase (RNA polymerase elongator complex component)